jgi:hypothetical protein
MAKIQTKKININDFSETSRPDMAKLARSLNPFYDDIERAFRKGFSIEDNLPMQYQKIILEVDGSGTPTQRTVLTTSLTNIQGCVIVKAVCLDAFPTAAPFITFNQTGSTIEIQNVAGLPASKKFTLTILLVN